jgi:septal ring factor EnvC (AmiA/AmiB activator)
MSDNVELALILRNTETASRDARAAFDATERLVEGIGPRLSSLVARLSALEARVGGIEKGLDGLARSNYKIETMLADITARLPTT